MNTKILFMFVLAIFAFALSVCSFSTANVSELKFGKNDTAKPSAIAFNTGDKYSRLLRFQTRWANTN